MQIQMAQTLNIGLVLKSHSDVILSPSAVLGINSVTNLYAALRFFVASLLRMTNKGIVMRSKAGRISPRYRVTPRHGS